MNTLIFAHARRRRNAPSCTHEKERQTFESAAPRGQGVRYPALLLLGRRSGRRSAGSCGRRLFETAGRRPCAISCTRRLSPWRSGHRRRLRGREGPSAWRRMVPQLMWHASPCLTHCPLCISDAPSYGLCHAISLRCAVPNVIWVRWAPRPQGEPRVTNRCQRIPQAACGGLHNSASSKVMAAAERTYVYDYLPSKNGLTVRFCLRAGETANASF